MDGGRLVNRYTNAPEDGNVAVVAAADQFHNGYDEYGRAFSYVERGGSWGSFWRSSVMSRYVLPLTSSRRDRAVPNTRSPHLGFRLVRIAK